LRGFHKHYSMNEEAIIGDILIHLFLNPVVGLGLMGIGATVLVTAELVSIPVTVITISKITGVIGMFQTIFSTLSFNTGTHFRRD
jgi:hypothetical protein